jgi:hypothetical protein
MTSFKQLLNAEVEISNSVLTNPRHKKYVGIRAMVLVLTTGHDFMKQNATIQPEN